MARSVPVLLAVVAALATVAALGTASAERPPPSELPGCFVLEVTHDGARIGASWSGSREIVRCLAPGGAVVERRIVRFSSPAGGRALVTFREGAWSSRGALLRITWSSGDEGEWETELFEGGLDIGGELWRRVEIDPAALRAEAWADDQYEEVPGDADGADDGGGADDADADDGDADDGDADDGDADDADADDADADDADDADGADGADGAQAWEGPMEPDAIVLDPDGDPEGDARP